MVGSSVDWIERKGKAKGKAKSVLFSLKDLSRPADSAFATPLKSISLDVRAGEILGIAGISGNGQEEFVEALTGEWRCPEAGMITFDGAPIGRLNPKGRRRLGIEMVPEERNGHAAVPDMTLVENTFLTHFDRMRKSDGLLGRLMTHAGRGEEMTTQIVADHDVRTPRHNPMARQLSGGNLQKFIMGRMLVTEPKLAIIAQPTWGVDVGAATMIRRSLLALAERGCGIILISQDLEEIFSLSDRIAVLNEGAMSPAQDAVSLTAEDVGLLMGGTESAGAA